MDANSEIGAGHLMRCLTIADAMAHSKNVQNRITPVFIAADSNAQETIQQHGYECVVLHTEYRNMEEELPVMQNLYEQYCKQAVQGRAVDLPGFLLVDSYSATKDYLEQMNELLPVYYMDDILCPDYRITGLINYNVYATSLPYRISVLEGNHPSERMHFLLGGAYVPVRNEFLDVKCKINKCVKDAMITSGGADKYNACGKIAGLLAERYPDICFHVISGAFNQNLSKLEQLKEQYHNIMLHVNVTKMSEIMSQCDLAIASAGSTIYELCAVGLPTITYYFVDNQELIAQAVESQAGIPNAGHLAEQEADVLEQLVMNFEQMISSYDRRLILSRRMMDLVDGEGATRIANEFNTLFGMPGEY